ncbi:hypothetical protein JB92DRAFT_2835796 [Gautieria morchelliformis]|nr:hypothetical protein JB92DRAFT_2835796 [Gautieria morchelliformis]
MSRPGPSNYVQILPSLSSLGLREHQPSRPASVGNLTLPPMQQHQHGDWQRPRALNTQNLPTLGSLGLYEQPPPRPLQPRELTLPPILNPQQWDLPGPPMPNTFQLPTIRSLGLLDRPQLPPPWDWELTLPPIHPPNGDGPAMSAEPQGPGGDAAAAGAAAAEAGRDDQGWSRASREAIGSSLSAPFCIVTYVLYYLVRGTTGPGGDAAAAEAGRDDQGWSRDSQEDMGSSVSAPFCVVTYVLYYLVRGTTGPGGDAAAAGAAAAEPGRTDQLTTALADVPPPDARQPWAARPAPIAASLRLGVNAPTNAPTLRGWAAALTLNNKR